MRQTQGQQRVAVANVVRVSEQFRHHQTGACKWEYSSKSDVIERTQLSLFKAECKEVAKRALRKMKKTNKAEILLEDYVKAIFTPELTLVLCQYVQANLDADGKKSATPQELVALFRCIFYCMAFRCSISFLYDSITSYAMNLKLKLSRMQELFTAFAVSRHCKFLERAIEDGSSTEFFVFETRDGADQFYRLEQVFTRTMGELFFVPNQTILTFDDHQVTTKGIKAKQMNLNRRQCRAKASTFGVVFEVAVAKHLVAPLVMRLRRNGEAAIDAMNEVVKLLVARELAGCLELHNLFDIDRDYFRVEDVLQGHESNNRINLRIIATCKSNSGIPFVLSRMARPPDGSNQFVPRYISEEGPTSFYVATHRKYPEIRVLAYRTGTANVVFLASVNLFEAIEEKPIIGFFGEPNDALRNKGQTVLDVPLALDDESPPEIVQITQGLDTSLCSMESFPPESDVDDSELECVEDMDAPGFGWNSDHNSFCDLIRTLRQKYLILTATQRSADWFLLRKFRITGRGAAVAYRLDRLNEEKEKTTAEQISYFANSSWFLNRIDNRDRRNGQPSRSKAARAIRNGILFEDSIVASTVFRLESLASSGLLGAGKRLLAVSFNAPLIACRDKRYLAVSPDAIVSFSGEDGTKQLASVEVKFCDSDTTRRKCHRLAQDLDDQFISLDYNDDQRSEYVFDADKYQVIHQATVLDVDYVYYVRGHGGGLYYIVEVFVPQDVRTRHENLIDKTYCKCLKWYYEPSSSSLPELESYGRGIDRDTFLQHVEMSKELERWIRARGKPEVPLKSFKPIESCFHNQFKSGLDTLTEICRSIRIDECAIKDPGQRLTLQFFMAMAVAIRSLKSATDFYLHKRLRRMTSMGDWKRFKDSSHVLTYRRLVMLLADDDTIMTAVISQALLRDHIGDEDLGSPARRRKRKRNGASLSQAQSVAKMKRLRHVVDKTNAHARTAAFWDLRTPEGGRRLRTTGAHVPISIGYSANCFICTKYNSQWRKGDKASLKYACRGSTTYKCSTCEVKLCTKRKENQKYSCFELFHSPVSIVAAKGDRVNAEKMLINDQDSRENST